MKYLPVVGRVAGLCTVLLSASLLAQDIDLESNDGKVSYGIGVNIGMNVVTQLQSQFAGLDTEAVIAGFTDAISGDLKLSEDEIMQILQAFAMEQQQQAQEQQMAAAESAAESGQAFLAENGQRPEVTTTASGLQYEVLEQGETSAAMPKATDTVNVHYHGTLIDGTVFDSSVERGEPISFPLNGVIPGWTEGLQLMRVGDKFRFYIPSDLAYGPGGAGGVIGPNSTLIFDVELLDIE